jgi:patatin-like phospholipase/acyl hydrolase
VPENFNVNDALTHDVLFPSWNINTKKPVFFSKMTSKKYGQKDPMYNIPMSEMVWASSVNPSFFSSAKMTWKNSNNEEESNLFFGGDTVATCPALYAHFLSTSVSKIPAEKISILAIGNQDYSSMKISDQVSVLDWISRLY